MANEQSKRVMSYRQGEGREAYNAYMRDLRNQNPNINLKDDLRRARNRAEKAGREFDESAWLAGRSARQAVRGRAR